MTYCSLGLGLGLIHAPRMGMAAPAGYQFLFDEDGAGLIDADGALLMEAA